MKTYTKTGDDGSASMLNGERKAKNDEIFHFIGTADELNSHLGLVRARLSGEDNRRFIYEIQTALMKLMAHASDSSDEKYFFTDNEVTELEREIDRLSENLPKKFQLTVPGENETEAQVHIARTVARRAERHFIAISMERPLNRQAAAYLNRLSDYLFVLSQQNSL